MDVEKEKDGATQRGERWRKRREQEKEERLEKEKIDEGRRKIRWRTKEGMETEEERGRRERWEQKGGSQPKLSKKNLTKR